MALVNTVSGSIILGSTILGKMGKIILGNMVLGNTALGNTILGNTISGNTVWDYGIMYNQSLLPAPGEAKLRERLEMWVLQHLNKYLKMLWKSLKVIDLFSTIVAKTRKISTKNARFTTFPNLRQNSVNAFEIKHFMHSVYL